MLVTRLACVQETNFSTVIKLNLIHICMHKLHTYLSFKWGDFFLLSLWHEVTVFGSQSRHLLCFLFFFTALFIPEKHICIHKLSNAGSF